MVGCNTLVLFTAFSLLLCDVSANIGTEARTFRDNIAVDPKEACHACLLNWRFAAGEFDELTYTEVRKLMNSVGLHGSLWHVGHIIPNEPGTLRKGRGAGLEDKGINLFAQHRHDNLKLGASKASHAELVHYCRIVPRMSFGYILGKRLGKQIHDTSLRGVAWLRSHIDSVWFGVPDLALESRLLCSDREESGESRGRGDGSGEAVEKGVVIAMEKGAVKAVEKGAVKAVEKGAVHVAKWVPGAGLAVGAHFAGERAQDGHHGQAALEAVAGVASVVPVVGTAASMAIDGVNFLIDVSGYNF